MAAPDADTTGTSGADASHPLTAERWKRIKEIFEAVVDLPSAQRAPCLDEACGDDAELRSRVEAMLKSDSDSETLLDGPISSIPPSLIPKDEDNPIIGSRIGRHRVVEEIRRGGMGAVYLAVRDDDQYQEQVAIKLIKRGMDTDFIVERFRQERQILASLDHPNIARLLDGGVTDDGLPYFVMEYIDGVPIDVYCDEHRLSLRARLELFRKVCSAVRYAHRSLVVHRDLKPSNILVTAEGEPKLLDFGIAKLMEPGGSAIAPDVAEPGTLESMVSGSVVPASGHVAATATGQRLMTPEYASPEQVRGEPVTTASDAYSLGVVLFQLLTGHRPYRFRDRSALEVERVICGEQPERASEAVTHAQSEADEAPRGPETLAAVRGTTPERLSRQLRGDLENIISKALRKEPERRYGSAEALSEDLRRYLEGLPVSARQDTLTYRAGKFVRRHKIGVLASAVVLISLLGGIAATTWQARVARDAQARAESARATEEGVSDFLYNLLEGSDPDESGGRKLDVDKLFARVKKTLLDDEFEGRDEVKAGVMFRVGQLYQSFGYQEEAEQLLIQALEVRKAFHGDEHLEVAESLNGLGTLYRGQGKLKQAEPLLREGLAMRRRLLPEESEEVAESLSNLGVLLTVQGELEEAETSLRKSLTLHRDLDFEDPEEQQQNIAAILGNLAGLMTRKRDLEAAEELYREALKLNRELHGEEFPQYARGLVNLANLLFQRGEPEKAESLFLEALEVNRKVFGEESPQVSLCLYSLGVLRHRAGDRAAAEPLYREALALDRKLQGSENDSVAGRLASLGKLRSELGDSQEGETLLRESLEIRLRIGAEPWRTAFSRSELAGALIAQGHTAEAEEHLKAAHEVFEEAFGADHRFTLAALERLVTVYETTGQEGPAATYRTLLRLGRPEP